MTGAGPILLASTLAALTALLAALSVRGLWRFHARRSAPQLMWGLGLLCATAAMAIETVIYLGIVDEPILQAYVFLSAAIVGVLSLGATRVLGRRRIERAYAVYIALASALLAGATALTPLPFGMVRAGIISGDPPVALLALSSLITVPATVVLLTASLVALRRDRRWPTLFMIAGALILGAGGTLYIASVPIALYYAEFLGILLLFFGLVSLPAPAPAATAAPASRPAG